MIVYNENKKEITFNIAVTMHERWVRHFLAMLQHMEEIGKLGSSKTVSFYADGDGGFKPKFFWDDTLERGAEPIIDKNGNNLYGTEDK